MTSLSPKESARLIRSELRAAFPACRFSVVTERGSMVSSVRVSWTDGPTVKLVEEITDKYAAGSFDGMTDSYDYAPADDRTFRVDGRLVIAGCRYIFTTRRISARLANRCIQQVAAFWGGVERVPVATETGSGYYVLPPDANAIRPDLQETWRTAIYQAAEDASQYVRDRSV